MKMTEGYIKAKLAKVGDFVQCPACGRRFEKKSYNQVFCSNAKTKLSNNCKDRYWNTVDPKKRNNTTRISPANAAWSARQSVLREERTYYENYDPGDSEYWDNSDNGTFGSV